MTNLTSDLYAVDMYEQVVYGGAERFFDSVSGTVSFDIYAADNSCTGKLITKSVTLPSINPFYDYAECKLYPDFKYCQLWGDPAIDNETFQNELDKYNAENENKMKNINQKDGSILNIVLDTLNKNMFMFVFFIVIIVITILYLKIKNRRVRSL